jgi:hypothetical protein
MWRGRPSRYAGEAAVRFDAEPRSTLVAGFRSAALPSRAGRQWGGWQA